VFTAYQCEEAPRKKWLTTGTQEKETTQMSFEALIWVLGIVVLLAAFVLDDEDSDNADPPWC